MGTPLYQLSNEQLAHVDIAAMNLYCARSLPGAEDVDEDTPGLLAHVDLWSRHVARRTAERSAEYDADPARFQHRRAYFLIYALVTTLQDELGVFYHEYSKAGESNSASYEPKQADIFFSDSRQSFLHGLLLGKGGTCASLPVMITAIGRRLGYPLKLVIAGRHVLARWDDPHGERFNIEAPNRGFTPHSDRHYVDWLQPKTQWPIEPPAYLVSLTPRQELALFYDLRADCLFHNGDAYGAKCARQLAVELHPECPGYRWCFSRDAHVLEESHAGRLKYFRIEDSPLSAGRPGYWVFVSPSDRYVQTWDELVARRRLLKQFQQLPRQPDPDWELFHV